MKTQSLSLWLSGFVGLALLAVPQAATACASCFGKSSDAMAHGMNMGILALLVVITSVLIGVASFAIFLARRATRFPVVESSGTSDTVTASPAAQPFNSTPS